MNCLRIGKMIPPYIMIWIYLHHTAMTKTPSIDIMRDGRPIGELQLKQIDMEIRECTLSIHMQNDTVKGQGYGTYAEKLALKYAFDVLGMAAVNADTVIKNTRSQHVLEKAGFQYIEEKNGFKYYRCVQ